MPKDLGAQRCTTRAVMKGPSLSCNFVQRDATRHQTQQAFFPSRPEYCTAKEKNAPLAQAWRRAAGLEPRCTDEMPQSGYSCKCIPSYSLNLHIKYISNNLILRSSHPPSLPFPANGLMIFKMQCLKYSLQLIIKSVPSIIRRFHSQQHQPLATTIANRCAYLSWLMIKKKKEIKCPLTQKHKRLYMLCSNESKLLTPCFFLWGLVCTGFVTKMFPNMNVVPVKNRFQVNFPSNLIQLAQHMEARSKGNNHPDQRKPLLPGNPHKPNSAPKVRLVPTVLPQLIPGVRDSIQHCSSTRHPVLDGSHREFGLLTRCLSVKILFTLPFILSPSTAIFRAKYKTNPSLSQVQLYWRDLGERIASDDL